ncbi:MAG: hypothetical protein AB7Q00_11960 [Phycisphaerales bacterium]
MGDQPHTPPNNQSPNPQPDKDVIGLEEDINTSPPSHAVPAHHPPTHAPRREPSRQAENARATSALAASRAVKPGTTNQSHRGCSSCGYDLFGLPIGKPCPECGAPPPSSAEGTVRDGIMRATDTYLRRIRDGAVTMAMSIILNAALTFAFFLADERMVVFGARVSLTSMWAFGVLAISSKRTLETTTAKDPIDHRVAMIARWSQWLFPMSYGLQMLDESGTSTGIDVAAGLLKLGGLAGVFAVGLLVGQICDWAQDTALGFRARVASFIVGGGLTLSVVLVLAGHVVPAFAQGIFAFIGSASALCFFIAGLVFAWSMLQFAKMATWAVQNKDVRNERDRQLRERAERERRSHEASKSLKNDPLTISKDTPCTNCGYNLIGLRRTARCPECGNDISE